MNYKVLPTKKFLQQAKRLLKKYKSLRTELLQLESELKNNPVLGISLGHQVFKIRVGVKSKGGGKSGGMRVLTYVITKDKEVYLLTIYDKSEQDSVDNKTIQVLIKDFIGK